MGSLKVAVITGGHPFDLPSFHQLFRQLNGVDAYIQHLDDFGSCSDEVRDSYDVAAEGHLLLTVDHPDTMKATAWTRQVQMSRVFCFQLGHGSSGWNHPSFQKVLQQGIYWVAQTPVE